MNFKSPAYLPNKTVHFISIWPTHANSMQVAQDYLTSRDQNKLEYLRPTAGIGSKRQAKAKPDAACTQNRSVNLQLPSLLRALRGGFSANFRVGDTPFPSLTWNGGGRRSSRRRRRIQVGTPKVGYRCVKTGMRTLRCRCIERQLEQARYHLHLALSGSQATFHQTLSGGHASNVVVENETCGQ